MAKRENPPFERGATFYNGGTIDTNNLGGENLEGTEWEFEDLDFSAGVGVKNYRTNTLVKCLCVRNKAAISLLPKRLVKCRKTGANLFGHVDGYATVTADAPVFPVDEWLPAAGVVVNDLFYIVVAGAATVLTDLAGGSNNVFSVGDVLVALTAATSGATTAGRVAPQSLTGATAVLGEQIQGRIGRALSAKSTANTNGDLLAMITKH